MISNLRFMIECTDADYQMAEMIGNKLILHMAMAYRMIKGAEQVSVPKIQPLDQRKMLLSLLPEEFESKQLIEEAKAQGAMAEAKAAEIKAKAEAKIAAAKAKAEAEIKEAAEAADSADTLVYEVSAEGESSGNAEDFTEPAVE